MSRRSSEENESGFVKRSKSRWRSSEEEEEIELLAIRIAK